jgi:hypothetical protein
MFSHIVSRVPTFAFPVCLFPFYLAIYSDVYNNYHGNGASLWEEKATLQREIISAVSFSL